MPCQALKETGQRRMKSAKVFLVGMYVHLFLSVLTPAIVLLFCKDGWNVLGVGVLLFYFAMIFAVHIAGWICVVRAVNVYHHNQTDLLRSGWRLLKLYTIPFYVLNFLYSFLVWFVLIGASRGIMFLLVPIPIIITCSMIFQSGCVGICYIMHVRDTAEDGSKPSKIHYLFQILGVVDVISTIYLLCRYGREKA